MSMCADDKPLYWKDAYMKEFDTVVESVSGDGEKSGKFVVLDKTAFYPHGGGQPCDFGLIKNQNGEVFKVLFVGKFDGKISHEVDKVGLKIGDSVRCAIDWERRYKFMRMHTAAHLFASIIHNSTGAMITGNQLGTDESRIDFSLQDFNKEKVQEYIDKANEFIKQNLPVSSYFISREEAEKDQSLFKLARGFDPLMKELRIVKIQGVDKQADGGTHIKNLGEIGKIVLVRIDNKGKDNRRVYFKLEI